MYKLNFESNKSGIEDIYKIRFKDTKRPVNGYFKKKADAFDALKTQKFSGVTGNFEIFKTHKMRNQNV